MIFWKYFLVFGLYEKKKKKPQQRGQISANVAGIWPLVQDSDIEQLDSGRSGKISASFTGI
jgi:hypothetical protein